MSDTPRTDAAAEIRGYEGMVNHARALERELAEQAPLVEKAIRDLAAGALEVREARNEILRADTDARLAIARCAELERELEQTHEEWATEALTWERGNAALEKIAAFLPGHGDAAEIAAKIARHALDPELAAAEAAWQQSEGTR